MSEVIFTYNGKEVKIQCQNDESMKDIFQRFISKTSIGINTIYFIYGGKIINEQLTFDQLANEEDKKRKTMNIIVNSHKDSKLPKIIKSKDIICPKCKENCKINIKDYKITLNECPNDHILNNISLEEYNETQNIDESDIICDNCKNIYKSQTYNNKFYRCLTCNLNLCLLCKLIHNQKDYIIEYEEKNYKCKIHNEPFNNYCTQCKTNLCFLCEKPHLNHKNSLINFGNIIPDIENSENYLSQFRIKLNEFNNIIKGIIYKLDKIVENMEIIYQINHDMIFNYKIKNRNYQILNNINNISEMNKNI